MEKNYVKHSISKRFTVIFVLVTACTFLLCIFLTNTFLEKFYLKSQQNKLLETFEIINEASVRDEFNDDEFKKQLQIKCSRSNLDVLVLDVDSQIVTYAGNNPEQTKIMLWDRLFLGQSNNEEIMESQGEALMQTDLYTMKIVYDPRLKNQNLTMWGSLTGGNLFLIRSALESIQDSVKIANHFLIMLGTIAILGSGLVIWMVTKKMTKPIMELADLSNRMSHLDFEAVYEGEGEDEIALLGKNFNSMSTTLENTISELKEANMELQRDIQKKEQMEEMRNDFISSVSHELKTPIALIQGYAEALQEGIADDEDSRNEYYNIICDETDKMNQIVQKLLALNQLEFGKYEIRMERFNLVDFIRNQIQQSSILLKQNGIRVHLQDQTDVYAWADEVLLIEVINNFLSNAIHYCDGEKIIDFRFEIRGTKVRTICFNTGENIPEASIPHLWDKFYKVDKARTRSYGGSGVGLSIVKAIMDTAGQQYGVENYENGVGFWFELDRQ